MPPFIPLADYTAPALATEASLRRLLRHAREVVGQHVDADPVMDTGDMRRTGPDTLDALAPPPACGPLRDELDETLLAWSGTPDPEQRLRLVVLPPGDPDDLIASWARRHGARLVEPPLRSDLVTPGPPALSTLRNIDPGGTGILVIPKLERWFLRHRNGLGHLRGLLDWLATLERPCLVGCDSWAWSFARKAADADRVLPPPLTFAPFDATRLHAWFDALREEEGETRPFRLAATGEDVFATGDGDAPACDWFTSLAARSYGIPWVAWSLWRRSLRRELPEGETDDPPETDTLWIAEPDMRSLPDSPDRAPLMVLQTLLLHGPLTLEELRAVLPMPHQTGVVPALVTHGLARRDADTLRIVPSAYPEIREAIAANGIARDVI